MLSVAKGSIEPFVVTVADRLKLIDSLEGEDVLPTYSVRAVDESDDEVWILANESASATNLSISCPVDTSLDEFVSGFLYELYCEFTYESDPNTLRVRFGPFIFAVDHPPPPVGS